MCLTLCYPMDYSTTGFSVPSLSPRVCSISCPLIRPCHPTISSSVTPFSSSPQSCSSPPKDSHVQISSMPMCFKNRDCSTDLTFPFSSVEFKEEIQCSNWLHCPWGQSAFLHSESLIPCISSGLGDHLIDHSADLSFVERFFWEISRTHLILLMWLLIPTPALLTAWSASESVNNSTTSKPSGPAGSGSY